LALSATSAAFLAVVGCSAGNVGKPPDVDPQAAAGYALQHYDANGDGALQTSELSRCPALAAAHATLDIDADGRISKSELTDNLVQMYGSQVNLTEMNCTVTLNGRPFAGATVRLRPIEMLGDALPPAQGVTDSQGSARPSIDDALLPEPFRERPLVYAGLYRVEITHPRMQLPSRYNTATELGCYVDPAARSGTLRKFDLSSK
jgi:hypothetical protein